MFLILKGKTIETALSYKKHMLRGYGWYDTISYGKWIQK